MSRLNPFAIAIVLVALLRFGSRLAVAIDYYVSAQGDDRADGVSPDSAWRSIDRVRRVNWRPGDRLLFRGGDVFEGELLLGDAQRATEDSPLEIGSYGQSRATIRTEKGTAVEVRNWAGVTIRDLILEGVGPKDWDRRDKNHRDKSRRDKNPVWGLRVVNTLPGEVRLAGARVENLECSGFSKAGIFVGGDAIDGSKSGFEDVLIDGCNCHDNIECGILVWAAWSDPFPTTYAHRDVTIRNCVAHDNTGDPENTKSHSGNGILLSDVDEGRIESSSAYRNGKLCPSQGGGPVGIWAFAAKRVTIERCVSCENGTGEGIDGGGFDLDGGVSDSTLQFNYSSGNDGAGYLLYQYDQAPHEFARNVVRYCVSENDGRKNRYGGIHVANDGSSVRDIRVHNNAVFVSEAPDGNPCGVHLSRTERVACRDNVFMTTGVVPLARIENENQETEFVGNCYWNPSGSFRVEWRGDRFADLAAWRKATGMESSSRGASGLAVDPLFENAGQGGPIFEFSKRIQLSAYRLPPASPLVDAGQGEAVARESDSDVTDFFGTAVPQGSGPDIGPCEYPSR